MPQDRRRQQLVKYGSKAAAEFLAKYKGVPCGHSINGRPNPADPCTAEERSLVAVTLNAPPPLPKTSSLCSLG